MKGKVLFLIKVPPPITGATVMNRRIYESSTIRDNFITGFILMKYLRHRNELGTLSIRKIGIMTKTILIRTKKLIVDKPDIIYFHITPNGIGFLRDSVYILLIKLSQVSLVLHFRGKGVRASSTTVLQRKYYKFRSEEHTSELQSRGHL